MPGSYVFHASLLSITTGSAPLRIHRPGRPLGGYPGFFCGLVSTLRLPEDDREASATKTEALSYCSRDSDLGSVRRHAEVLTEYPHLTCAVVNLIHTTSESSK